MGPTRWDHDLECVYALVLQEYQDCFCTSLENKKKIYGKHRVAVGGKTKGKETDSEDDDAAEEVKAEGEVPPALETNAEGKQKETKRYEER